MRVTRDERIERIRVAWPAENGRQSTHWDGCDLHHQLCAIAALLDAYDEQAKELAALRKERAK